MAKNLAAFGLYSESLSGAKFEADILSCLAGENSKATVIDKIICAVAESCEFHCGRREGVLRRLYPLQASSCEDLNSFKCSKLMLKEFPDP